MSGLRQWAVFAMWAVALACAGVALVATLDAEPAGAFSAWAHDGAPQCVDCHNGQPLNDQTCTQSCHASFKSFPGRQCWSCHVPGAATSPLSTPSSACSQGCHLWDEAVRGYTVPYTHGASPHLGSTPACLGCHQTSAGIPHHNGAQQFDSCTACHNGLQEHAGKVSCAACHSSAVVFHLYQASSPGFSNCRSCHAKKHAGKKVPQSKCATCHKGTGSGGAAQAQHSTSVTKAKTCSACHSKALHAKKRGSGIRTCRTCHKSKFHAGQKSPSNSVCTACHGRAARHSSRFACVLCHRSAVHNARPAAIKIR